eukprot:6199241-Pleurochrysis_carterae.AAC.3
MAHSVQASATGLMAEVITIRVQNEAYQSSARQKHVKNRGMSAMPRGGYGKRVPSEASGDRCLGHRTYDCSR